MSPRIASIAVFLGLAAAMPSLAAPPPDGGTSVAPLVRMVTPAVVNISTLTRQPEIANPLLQDPFFRHFFDIPEHQQMRSRETTAAGSGVIVDAKNGYVLTNNHVVENADRIEVTTKDKRTFRARLIGRDEGTDVAVLKIDATDLASLPFGDSDAVEVGDYVLAIGNPFALGQTVTSGIVSAVGRSGLGIEGYEDFIQTDASINPGNSGGALVNFKGELIGINTAILAPGGGNVGIGFAVPINMARGVMRQLIETGKVSRGQIGVVIQDLSPELAQALNTGRGDGAVVVRIEDGSPAARAGLERGDVVVALDGTPIRAAADLRNRIALVPVGRRIALTVERDGRQRAVELAVEPARQRRSPPARHPAMPEDDGG